MTSCSPSPRPSPLGRGRIVGRAGATPGRSGTLVRFQKSAKETVTETCACGSSTRVNRCPLSPRERVRVRGNKPFAFPSADERDARNGTRRHSTTPPFPSPRPSPLGRGRIVDRPGARLRRLDTSARFAKNAQEAVTATCACGVSPAREPLSPLPKGEGQGEGKLTVRISKRRGTSSKEQNAETQLNAFSPYSANCL
jgi:hypothetical protein